MKKRGWGVRLGEISTLIYLLFPFLSIFDEKRGFQVVYISVLLIFSISYLILVLYHDKLNRNNMYIMLIIHYLGIIYFVYSVNPMNGLFFFFSAFALPFIMGVSVKSKEFYTFIATMIICLVITYFVTPTYFVLIIVFYLVILIVTLGNFKAREDRKVREELEEKNKYINVLIAEQERNRIGQDLHDTLGHIFASLTLKSELAEKLIDKDVEAAKKEMNSVTELSRDALKKVRAIVEDLKVQSFEEEVKSVETILNNANLKFTFHNKGGAKSLNPAKQSILSMILREAINNIVKHAQATKVVGELQEEQNTLKMTISDNGIGINTKKVQKLQSIEERVNYLNGHLEFHSNNGTTLVIEIPRGDLK